MAAEQAPRAPLLAPALAGLASLSLIVSACGGSPVASVPSSTTTTATTTRSATRQGASVHGGISGGHGSRGTQPFGMMVGSVEQGRTFSACMRRHGTTNFPDPDAQGGITVTGIDRNSPTFRSALSACRKLLPNGFGQPPTAAQLEQVQQQLLGFSQCMRAHEINDFPDPSGGALPRIQPVGDLDPNSPRFQAAYDACKAHLPADLPGKALGGVFPQATGNAAGG